MNPTWRQEGICNGIYYQVRVYVLPPSQPDEDPDQVDVSLEVFLNHNPKPRATASYTGIYNSHPQAFYDLQVCNDILVNLPDIVEAYKVSEPTGKDPHSLFLTPAQQA